MPDIICNTSPLQYLHQLKGLDWLATLCGTVVIPPAVVQELAAGKALGVDVPTPQSLPWISVCRPASAAVLPLITDLGPGETEVLALALESSDAVVILDDALARRTAETLGIRVTGTLGILLDAKSAGLIPAVLPLLDALHVLRFRLHPSTRAAILKFAGEQE